MAGILLLCGGIALLAYGLIAPPPVPSHYSGQLMFQTKQEYTDFKLAIAQPSVTDWEANVLSSEPPIVVSFKATISPNSPFPYGDKARDLEESWIMQSGAFVGLVFLFPTAGCFLVWAFEEKA